MKPEVNLPKPDHPAFENYMHISDDFVIATFRVGYYQQVPQAVLEAVARIKEMINERAADIAAIREWNGNVVFYSPASKQVNTEVTEEMQEQFKAATREATKDGGWDYDASWVNSTHGLVGFSVRLRRV